MDSQTFKVGELVRRTGPTVRTLHHYDEIRLRRSQPLPPGAVKQIMSR